MAGNLKFTGKKYQGYFISDLRCFDDFKMAQRQANRLTDKTIIKKCWGLNGELIEDIKIQGCAGNVSPNAKVIELKYLGQTLFFQHIPKSLNTYIILWKNYLGKSREELLNADRWADTAPLCATFTATDFILKVVT